MPEPASVEYWVQVVTAAGAAGKGVCVYISWCLFWTTQFGQKKHNRKPPGRLLAIDDLVFDVICLGNSPAFQFKKAKAPG